MGTTALFVGAGASAARGYPVTNQLLPLMKEGLEVGSLFSRESGKTSELGKYLSEFLPGFDTVRAEHLPLITDILSLIDYALLTGNVLAKGATDQGLRRFRMLLEEALIRVLKPAPKASLSVSLLAQWLQSLSQPLGIISTNYDNSIESVLLSGQQNQVYKELDLGFSWRDIGSGHIVNRPEAARTRLYKLHGSLNWLRCDLCGHIYFNPYGDIVLLAYSEDKNDYNTCHCDHWPLRSVIVAPSLVRDVRDANLLEVWKHSLELLRQADEWLIVGYSFPPEDLAIRSLFLRAQSARLSPPRIRVIQRELKPDLQARFQLFFPNHEYVTGGFASFVESATQKG